MEFALIPSSEDFAELFLSWREEPNAKRFNPYNSMTLQQAAQRLKDAGAQFSEIAPSRECRHLVQIDGKVFGTVAITNFNGMMLTAEISYQISESRQGRGLGTAAVRRLVETVFTETPIRKLLAYVHEDNLASRRLIEKVGFKQEGLLREHYLIAGQPANEALYGLLRSEWTTRQG